MSKYFLDTEFLEGTQKERFPISLFRKNTAPTIDLISIGLVAEDGRELYLISKDFNLDEAWNRFQVEEQTPYEKQHGFEGRKTYWIRENVLKPIWIDLLLNYEAEYTFLKGDTYDAYEKELKEGKHDHNFTQKSLKALLNRYGKTSKEISREVAEFCNCSVIFSEKGQMHASSNDEFYSKTKTEFYAYYADYDWVAFAWLFGKMMDLPKGFPMYCKDLKQELDNYAEKVVSQLEDNTTEQGRKNIKNSISGQVEAFKTFPNYPKQENEHDALADARWNKKLYDFINKL